MSIKARAGRTKSLNALINKDTSILGDILGQAEKLKHIETLVLQKLPEDSRDFYRVGNFQQGRLVLLTSSAIHLTRFRYLKPQLLADLSECLPELSTIELKIRPLPPEPRKEKKGQPISGNTREKLRKLAEEVDNPKLKEALIRASHSPETKNQH
ncbi:DciA family protein [Marinospirillum sp.]|uniref:DUF721 domain-containing protein n=1 Tax=Marinospirillum sp. TaxID=2183934 RepID=UPI00286FD4E8|nr:DciA family protein [Marinospirillum sp.]MDR9468941.1 DciA family protein [Marinospirillum sp.]